MANIDEDLQKIKNAVKGAEVRDSIHDAIRDINDQTENILSDVQEQVSGIVDESINDNVLLFKYDPGFFADDDIHTDSSITWDEIAIKPIIYIQIQWHITDERSSTVFNGTYECIGITISAEESVGYLYFNNTYTGTIIKVTIPTTGSNNVFSFTEITQSGLQPGTGINISNNTVSVNTTEIQEKLIAGTGITITGNTISSTGGGGTSDIVTVMYTFNFSTEECTCDTSYNDILAAYNNGKTILPLLKQDSSSVAYVVYPGVFTYTSNMIFMDFSIVDRSSTGGVQLNYISITHVYDDIELADNIQASRLQGYGEKYTADDGIKIQNNIISTKDIFEITYTKGSNNAWTCDKQGSEILDAYNNNKKFIFYANIDGKVFLCGGYYIITTVTGGDILYAFLRTDNSATQKIALDIQHRIPNSSSGYSEMIAVNTGTVNLQPKLSQGSNITISGNVISATDTTYSDGNGININGNNVISLKAKSNGGIAVDNNGVYVDKNETLEIDTNNKLGISEEIQDTIETNTMIGNASGSVASFNDGGANMPMKSLVVAIEPVQAGSGDPSPINERPISGWTECNVTRAGENIWDEQWEVGTINVNTGAEVEDNTRIRNKGYIAIKENTTYHFTIPVNDGRIVFYKADKTYLSQMAGSTVFSNKYFTSPSGAYYVRFSPIASYGTTYNNDISINYPSTDTSYHAYKGNTYNIQFPSEAGTVYGGALDVTNGVLTVTYNYTDMGGLSWTYHPASGQYRDFFDTNLPNDSITGRSAYAENLICERYKSIPSAQIAITGYDNGVMALANGTRRLIVCDTNYTSASDLATALSGKPIVYPLATSITYQLTPTEVKTLLGINNIFADCGDIKECEYTRDATTIINEILARVPLEYDNGDTEEY